jgi:RNA 3'-terminal phosphate cyclase (ATP)
MSKKTIEIDGSLGEGGGQILRTSLALALITGQSFHLRHIRAGRRKPGLQAQHLMSVKAAASIGQARQRGASLGSSDLVFEPGEVVPGDYHFRIGTAGATSLVLHTIYLPLARAGAVSQIAIEGGTHVKASPSAHFLQQTWSAYMRSLGITVQVELDRPGFYPRGGGAIRARIEPAATIRPFRGLTTEGIKAATIYSAVAGLPAHIAERQERRAATRLHDLGMTTESHLENWQGGPGSVLGIQLPTAPAPTFFFALGEKGIPAETVADEAADQVAHYLAAQPPGVDEHSADQLLLPLAFAGGPSEFRVANISSHLLTNAEVVQFFLDRTVRCEGNIGEPGIVRIGQFV